jgi:hypothetical protein
MTERSKSTKNRELSTIYGKITEPPHPIFYMQYISYLQYIVKIKQTIRAADNVAKHHMSSQNSILDIIVNSPYFP